MTDHDPVLSDAPRHGKPPRHALRTSLTAAGVIAVLAAGGFGVRYWSTHRSAAAGPHGEHEHAGEQGHDPDGHADEVHLDESVQRRWSIAVEPARLATLKPSIELPGRVSFDQERVAHVATPLRGRAVDISVKIGDAVEKGAPLLVVESPELGDAQGDYLQKRTLAENAGPKVELAKNVYERARSLLDQSQLMTRSEVERREIEYREAQAGQRAAQAALRAAENRLHLLGMIQENVEAFARTGEIAPRLAIVSPIDGEVIARPVTKGELVSPDRESLLTIADLRTLWVLVDVPEAKLREIRKGARARILLDRGETPPIDGIVALVSATVDQVTRTGFVRVEVHQAQGVLRPGMFVRTEVETALPVQLSGPVLAIPDEAVQTVDGHAVVFVPVAGEPGAFQKRPVVVGQPVMGLVPVLSGLKEGEPYVASGTFILKAEFGKASAEHDH